MRNVASAVLFVLGTLAALFVVYVVWINIAASLDGDGGDWTQSLFAIIPAAIAAVAAFTLRAILGRRG